MSRLHAIVRRDGVVPALVSMALCLPCLGIGYFWDDYYFLTFKGTGDPRVYLLPDPQASFYRPISQSIYYLFLRLVDPASGLVGHLINFAVLAGSVYLLTRLVAAVAGSRAGFASGVAFAALGPVPGLVAWVSCCQDLFAIALIIAALTLRHAGRNAWALVAIALAILCKEPALAFIPVLVLWDWLVGRRPSRIVRHAILYGALVLAWAAIHPGFHILSGRGFQSGATGYIGLEHPERWGRYLIRYILSLLNIPINGLATAWPRDRTAYGALAFALVLAWAWIADRRLDPKRTGLHMSAPRVGVLAILLTIPPLVLPSVLVRIWAPYYACIGGMGVALSIGFVMRRAGTRVLVSVLALFLALGIWFRGLAVANEAVWTERIFVEAGLAARQVEANFKRLHPTLPAGSQVLVSVTGTGFRGIRATLHEAQALRVWYGDPTITTRRPEQRRPGAPSEYLFRVTGALAVVEIDPDRFKLAWSGTGDPDPSEVSRPLRGYARALAGAGDTDRAVAILRRLAEVEKGLNRPYDLRLAGMVLLGAGRRHEAEAIFDSTAALPRDVALDVVRKLLTEPTVEPRLDSLSFVAFGLSAQDPEVLRYLMRMFRGDGFLREAVHFAHRLQRIAPGDTSSVNVIRDYGGRGRVHEAG